MNPPLQTKSGNISVKPAPHRNWRRHIRMEKIARLELSGKFSNMEIANIVGVTVQALWYIKSHPDYLRKRAELSTGVIADLDLEARAAEESLRSEIRDSLPTALRCLRNAVERGAVEGASVQEIKLGVEAAKEFIDREGTFSKVSKAEIKVKNVPSTEAIEKTENDLMAMLQNAQKQREAEEAQPAQPNSVSKTTHTATLDQFMNKNGTQTAQERMKQHIKFEDFDAAGKPVM